jgi:hypothetical protein
MTAELIRQGIFRGVDLRTLLARFWKLEAMRVEDKRLAPPEARFIRSKYSGGGHAKVWSRKIVVRVFENGTLVSVLETLLHELVHCSHYLSFPKDKCHSEMFCRRLIACAREAFGLDLDTAALLALPAARDGGRSSRHAYVIDCKIEEAMTAAGVAEKIRSDPTFQFTPPPPETEEQIAARRAALAAAKVEKRAARARAKLAEWERRILLARKRAAKWRVKVRYYDRRLIAARRPL